MIISASITLTYHFRVADEFVQSTWAQIVKPLMKIRKSQTFIIVQNWLKIGQHLRGIGENRQKLNSTECFLYLGQQYCPNR